MHSDRFSLLSQKFPSIPLHKRVDFDSRTFRNFNQPLPREAQETSFQVVGIKARCVLELRQ
jgi:hypothetical protein